MHALLIPSALLLGALLAVQAVANLQLAGALGSPLGASAAQLALGTAMLVALAAAVGTLGAAALIPSVTPWHLLGGLASALYISAGILVLPRLGAVSAVGLFIAGQMLTSLAVDALGVLGVDPRALDASAIAGGAAVLAGAAAIIRAGATGRAMDRRAVWVALALAAGAGLALQGPVNAQLRSDLDAPVTAGAFSFLVATAAMAAVLAAARAPLPRLPARRMPWWGWLGGLIGATYVTTVPLMLPHLGTAATLGLTVAGQQLASLAVDRYGLLRLPRRPLTASRTMGVALLLAGVAAIQLG